MTTTISIDTALLEKVRTRGDKLQARCPACAADGGDKRGDHFFANLQTGAWGCAAFPGDAEHRKQIFALVGIRGERPPERPDLREERRQAAIEAEGRAKLTKAAREARGAICERWRWDEADVWESSPTKIDQPMTEFDPRHFLFTLFPPSALVWSGDVHQSGTAHASRWRTVKDWQDADSKDVGPMVCPAIWRANTAARTAANVLTAPFCVLDFDELDGRKPETPKELSEHLAASRAIVRWLREGLGWRLAALLYTGSKSLHAWFANPGREALASLRTAAPSLGIDAGLIGRGEHPCRLPGWFHKKTGNRSRVLWLQLPQP